MESSAESTAEWHYIADDRPDQRSFEDRFRDSCPGHGKRWGAELCNREALQRMEIDEGVSVEKFGMKNDRQ